MSLPFQPVPLAAEVQVRSNLNGQEVENTFNFTSTFGWGQDELDALTAAVDAWVGASYLPNLASALIYGQTYARGLREPIEFESSNTASAGAGSGGTTTAPNNQAWAISRRTGRTGRSARGRIFLAGIPDNDKLDDNHIKLATVEGWQTIMAALDAAAFAAGWTEVIVSRVQAGVRLATALTYPVTEWVVVDNVLDSQRRRLPGRGA